MTKKYPFFNGFFIFNVLKLINSRDENLIPPEMLDEIEAGKDIYIENNKDFILQNATAYNYIFENNNDEYILVDFYKS